MDDLFLVEPEQFYLYKQNNKWISYSKYCFVKPIPKKEFYLDGVGVTEEPLWGTIKYTNEQLKKLEINEGDEVSFQPNSEYMFTINGEKLYRMFTNNITIKNGQ